jgi:hypothetical protein
LEYPRVQKSSRPACSSFSLVEMGFVIVPFLMVEKIDVNNR